MTKLVGSGGEKQQPRVVEKELEVLGGGARGRRSAQLSGRGERW